MSDILWHRTSQGPSAGCATGADGAEGLGHHIVCVCVARALMQGCALGGCSQHWEFICHLGVGSTCGHKQSSWLVANGTISRGAGGIPDSFTLFFALSTSRLSLHGYGVCSTGKAEKNGPLPGCFALQIRRLSSYVSTKFSVSILCRNILTLLLFHRVSPKCLSYIPPITVRPFTKH